MSNPDGFNASSLFLRLRPSVTHVLLHLVVFLLAACALYTNQQFQMMLKVPLTFVLLASLYYSMQRFVLLAHPRSVVEIVLNNGEWRLRLNGGEILNATLEGPLYVGSHFVVLRFRATGLGVVPVVISADAVNSDIFRRSQVLLRHGSVLPV